MNSLTKVTIAFALCAICSAIPLKLSTDPEDNIGLYQGDIAGISQYQDHPNRRGISVNKSPKWTNGVIYWKYDNPAEYSSADRAKFEAGMKLLEDNTRIGSTNCITFKKVSASNMPAAGNYVNIKIKGGCWSYLGMLGGKQEMSLVTDCSKGSVAHEFIHALGFSHEQNRPDRDNFVTVNMANVEANKASNYYKLSSADTSYFGQKYDFESIMHYGRDYFAINKAVPVMTAVDPALKNIEMGQRDHLSQADIKEIQTKYGCTGTPSASTTQAPASSAGNGNRRIRSVASGLVLNIDDLAVTGSDKKRLTTEVFYQQDLGGLIIFRSKGTDTFLSYNAGKVVGKKITGGSVSYNEVFVISPAANGAVNIKAYSGKYVYIESSNNATMADLASPDQRAEFIMESA